MKEKGKGSTKQKSIKRKKERRTQLLPKILVTLAFMIGMGIFLYPTISNYLLVRSQTLVINSYDDHVKKASKEEKSELKKKMDEYNQSRNESTPSLGDTFGDKNKEETSLPETAVDDEGNSVFDAMEAMLGPTIATLEIPKINLESPIYSGTTDDVLQKGLGWLEGSSLPTGGTGTHSVITGHRGLPNAKLFTDLPELEKGDQFLIVNMGEYLAYEVDQILTVEPSETDALVIEPEQDYVTLITCTPYMINSHRLFVRGHRVPYVAASFKMQTGAPAVTKYMNEYAAAGIGILLVLFFIIVLQFYLKKRHMERWLRGGIK